MVDRNFWLICDPPVIFTWESIYHISLPSFMPNESDVLNMWTVVFSFHLGLFVDYLYNLHKVDEYDTLYLVPKQVKSVYGQGRYA